MIAEDIMTSDPTSVTETTSIGDALGTLKEQGVRHLPVVRGTEVVGILSDRDFSSLGVDFANDVESIDQVRARLSQPVSVLMSGGVVSVEREAPLGEIIDLLLDEKLSALPVVEAGTQELVGIVSYVDVLRAARDQID